MNILRDYITEANRIDKLTKNMKAKNIEQSIWDNMNKEQSDTPWRYDALSKIIRDKDGNRIAEKVGMFTAQRIIEAVNGEAGLKAQVEQLQKFV